MGGISRRMIVMGGGAALVSACGNQIGSDAGQRIDGRVDAALEFMYANFPETVDLASRASGMLVMPLVTRAGLITLGGAYGEGALRIGGATVDYYSVTQASLGLQIGAQQYAHTLFFMTPEILGSFRASDGWEVGGDIEYVVRRDGARAGMNSTTFRAPVVAVIYGQAGLLMGASLAGTKYTRILR
ncbi:MAG: twin-arginine translocation pathway signal [Rhodobacteraceae bacterium]|nr:twin-arginine translocation pathway signal [Paracoccaceae bacterium]